MNKTILKPCPFCGCKEIRAEQYIVEAAVFCDNKKCRARIISPQSVKINQLQEAIKKWNKRVKNED